MAMQSVYDVLKEKEVELQELQRLLNEAQAVLSRVLELNAVVNDSARAARPELPSANGDRELEEISSNGWGVNPSTEFP
jgi:hypothetical protein